MDTVRTRRFVAKHSLPSLVTDALQAPVAKPVDASGERDALLAELAPVADVAVASEGLGAVAVLAGPVVDRAHRRLAHVERIAPARKTPHLAIAVTVVSAALLQVFGNASKFIGLIEGREEGSGLNHRRKTTTA